MRKEATSNPFFLNTPVCSTRHNECHSATKPTFAASVPTLSWYERSILSQPPKHVTHIYITAYLALSSCMGDSFRASISGVSLYPRNASFGRTYARAIGSGAGQAGWEQIEMQDMLDDSFAVEEEEDL